MVRLAVYARILISTNYQAFQFQYGAISGSLNPGYEHKWLLMFQFQYGAISGKNSKTSGTNAGYCFNSNMVRLAVSLQQIATLLILTSFNSNMVRLAAQMN